MKKVFLLFVLIFIGIESQCQSVFEGKVLSKDGKPLAEASVSIENSKSFVSTNDSGFFKLTIASQASAVKLSVSRVGFIAKKFEFKKSLLIECHLD